MKALAIVRNLKRVSQRELARRLGLSDSMLCRIEKGYRAAEPNLIPRIADALGMTVADLKHAMDVAELAQRTCEVRQ